MAASAPPRTALALPRAPLAAQAGEPATVDLVVTDSATGAPVTGARVTTPGVRYTALTDATGRVRLRDLAPGSHHVTVVHPQFAPRGRSAARATT